MSSKRSTRRSRETTSLSALRQQSQIRRAATRVWSIATGKYTYVAELGADSEAGLLKLSEHRTFLLPAFVIGLLGALVVWILALGFPFAVSAIYSNGANSNIPTRYGTLLNVLMMSIPFAPPFISVFALGNLLFPSSPGPDIAAGVMSTLEYRQKSNRRWLIVVASGICGALNCLLLLVAVTSATSG
jgi:hypothetical protein